MVRRFPGLEDLQLIELPTPSELSQFLNRYRNSDLIEFAEPNYFVHIATSFPNDPKFLDGTLWGLNNAGQNGGKPNADIDAPEAWANLQSASNVIVAIVDSGVRYTHEDLALNIWVNPVDGTHGTNAVTGTTDPADDNGHGTVIAGVIGARGNNGLGVVGVAWQVQIMACKFIDSQGNGTVSDAIACLEYARNHGAQIINASWGLEEFSLSLSNAILAARSAGIIVVAAAGNNSQNNDLFPYYPGSLGLDNVVAVAASTRTDAFYPLSNYGATNVHLAAPGYQIYSTSFQSDQSYILDEGTSIAAGFVSGAAALLQAKFPSEDYLQLIHRITENVDLLPNLVDLCASGGRLNLRRALGIPNAAPFLEVLPIMNGAAPQLRLVGSPGRTYVIEASTNFIHWNSLATNVTGFDATLIFTDNLPLNYPGRFYRALLVP